MYLRTTRPTLTGRRSGFSGASVIFLASILAAPAPAQRADDAPLPPAEELLDRHVEAIGGKHALLALSTRKKTGTLAVAMAGHEFEARVEEHFLAPDKSHVRIEGPGFFRVTVCDGVEAWEWQPQRTRGSESPDPDSGHTSLLEGVEQSRVLEKSDFHAALDWRKQFSDVRTLARVQVTGMPAYEVQVTTKSGETYSQFYDVGSGRLVKRVRAMPSGHMGELDMEIFFEDYREFDGVWMALRVRAVLDSATMGKGTQTFTYTSVEHDLKIPVTLFEKPHELKRHSHGESADPDHRHSESPRLPGLRDGQ